MDFPDKCLHPSVVEVVNDYSARSSLLKLLPQSHLRYPALRLSECQQYQSVLAPAFSATEGTETLRSTFRARNQKTRSDSSNTSVQHIRALLLGRLTADRDGVLNVCLGDAFIPVSIAPPPEPDARGRWHYFANWRYIPSVESGGGYFEILKEDITHLSPETTLTRPVRSCPKVSRAEHNLQGLVTAKSYVLSSTAGRSTFLVEIAGTRSATTVLFRRRALSWWPFINVGSQLMMRGLQLCSLPGLDGCFSFLASREDVSVKSLPRDTCHDTLGDVKDPARRSRSLMELSNRSETPSSSPLVMVTAEGTITRRVRDGKLELNGRMAFYVGPLVSSSAALPLASLREGTKIVAHNVIFLHQNSQILLVPTARTSVDISYFGDLDRLVGSTKQLVRQSWPWGRLWQQWSYPDLLWAVELFDTLSAKFWEWLTLHSDEQAQSSSEKVCFLLGGKTEVGLVQRLMCLLSGRTELLQAASTSHRNLYKEFLRGVTPPFDGTPSLVTVPTIRQFKRLVELYLDRMALSEPSEAVHVLRASPAAQSAWLHRRPVDCLSYATTIPMCFGGDQLGLSEDNTPVAIVGLIQGREDGDDGLILRDASGSLFAQCSGNLPPLCLGAVVLITEFTVIVNPLMSEEGYVLFSTEAVQVFMEGPFSKKDAACVSPKESESAMETGNTLRPRFVSSLRTNSLAETSMYAAALAGIVDVPLICLYVQAVCNIRTSVHLRGKLIAVQECRVLDVWRFVENADGVPECEIALIGAKACAILPILRENTLIGISCTELHDVGDVVSYVSRKRSSFGNSVVSLTSVLHTVLPWVEDLGRGLYMRFTPHGGQWITNSAREGGNSQPSLEGQCHARALRIISKLYAEGRAESEARLWMLNDGDLSPKIHPDNSSVTLRGEIESAMVSTPFSSLSEANTVSVTIVDELFGVFPITIEFYNAESGSTCQAIPGASVTVSHVQRVFQQGCRPVFVASRETTIRLTSIPQKSALSRCPCMRQLRRRLTDMLRSIPRLCLHQFLSSSSERRKPRKAGVLWFDVVELLRVRLWSKEGRGCETCESRTKSRTVVIGIEVLVVVDDGTSTMPARCEGFGSVSRLLGVTKAQACALKQVGSAVNQLELRPDNCEDGDLGAMGFSENLRHCVSVIRPMFMGLRSSVIAVVLDDSGGADYTVRGCTDEIIVKQIGVGYGRRLWTASRGTNERALSCVCVLSSDSRRDGLIQTRLSVIQAEIRNHFKET